MSKLTLRPLEDGDLALLTLWLNKEYILQWYHDPEEWLEEIRNRQSTYSWIHHFIVIDSGMPIGFCQYYDCYDANEMEDWYDIDEANRTFSIDYLIGEEAYLGKGCGKEIVRLLTDLLITQKKAWQIIVQPETDNHASNHVLMVNGYLYDEQKKYYCKQNEGAEGNVPLTR